MTKHFNKLTPAEAERLAMLAEEAAEVVQVVGKILRHGYESYHPKDPAMTNRMLLSREVSDLLAVVGLMDPDFDPSVTDNLENHLEKRMRYAHHQED